MASRIRIFTSALYLTTSGVVNGPHGALVIDPGILPREIGAIKWYVEQAETPAQYLVYTHHHWDHILGGQAFPSARRLAHRRFAEAMQAGDPLAEVCRFDDKFYIHREPPFEFQPPHETVEDGWAGSLGDVAFRLINLPGHTIDMLGVHIPAEKTLFAADMLSDVELPMIDGDGSDYLASLRKVDGLVVSGEVETLVPGHGHVARGADAIRARIVEDMSYIDRVRHLVAETLGQSEAAAVAACRTMVYRGQAGWPPTGKAHEENARAIYRAMRRGSQEQGST